MKQQFLWRQRDTATTETGGSAAIIKEIGALAASQKEQTEAVKTQLEKSLEAAKDEMYEKASKLMKEEAQKIRDEQSAKAATNFGGGGQAKSFAQEVEEKLTEHKEQLGKGAKFAIEMGRKAVGNMGSSASLTGSYFVAPTVVPGIVAAPYNETHLRNLLSTGTTNSNVIRHLRDNGGEGGPAMVAEAGTKPQMDRDLSIVDANVRKIATYLRVPEEMIEDIPYLTSFLTEIGTEEVLAVEDAQILYGDGTGQNISGLFTNATAFAAGVSVVATPNEYDVLGASVKQMRVAKRIPSVHLVSPTDYYSMISRKDTSGNYILQGGGNGIVPVTAGGVPVVQLNQVATGDFLTLDRRAAQLFFRSNISVRFYEQDQDNAIKNMVTIVIEERLALPIYFTNGLVKGTFTAAITDLTS